MIHYRQYAPEPELIPQLRINVAMELSRQASETDDPDEFFVEALANMNERASKKGGTWVHSFLDRRIAANYADPLYSAPFKVPVPFAKDARPVDMTRAELTEHLTRKWSRTHDHRS